MQTALVATGGAIVLTALVAYTAPRIFSGGDTFAPCRDADLAAVSALDGAFSLTSETGTTVTQADVITSPTLLYMGYTFCPDVCPLDNLRNVEAVELLGQQGIAARAVFVSIDPERDTPEVVAEYTGYFHEDLLGLTGTPDQVEAAAKSFRAVSRVRDEDDPDYYLIDHSTLTYLILPDHGPVDLVQRATTPAELADRVACFAGLTAAQT